MKELENEKLYEVDSKFCGLTPYNIENLTNDRRFRTLVTFAKEVDQESIADGDGNVEFVYIDSHAHMYTKTGECGNLRPSNIRSLIIELKEGNTELTYMDIAAAIREKFTDDGYKPFAVFWYNR